MAISRLSQTTLQNGFEKYNRIWDGRSAVGAMDAISAITLSAGNFVGDMEFNNIPQTYSHLQLRVMLRTNDTGTWNNQRMRFNGDTGTNYAFHILSGNGTTLTASATASFSSINNYMHGASNSLTSGIFGIAIIDILDYASTSKYKTIRVVNGGDSNGAGVTAFVSALWLNSTTGINSIQLTPSGGTAIQHSSFSLYGIK